MVTRKISPRHMPIEAVINVPGSKSVANRALVCAALAHGACTLHNVPDGDDTVAMLTALTRLGLTVDDLGGRTFRIAGDLHCDEPLELDAKLAGTTSRFLLALGLLTAMPITVTGDEALRQRPVAELANALRKLGAAVTPTESVSLPLTVSVDDQQQLDQSVTVRGDISSQYITALMLIGPMLPKGLNIYIDGDLVSRSYVAMTVAVMAAFGAIVEWNDSQIRIEPTGYRETEFHVEPDFSSAAFPIAAIAIAGGTLRIPQLRKAHLQGDAAIIDIAAAMGVSVEMADDDVVVSRDASTMLRPYSGDLSNCSDLVPCVAAMCAVADGVSHLDRIGFIRGKESDRLGDLADEMNKMGHDVKVLDDGLQITGVQNYHGALINTHHDHRLAMALSLLGMRTVGLYVSDSEVVSKSWPSFWADMENVVSHHEVDSVSPDVIVAFDFDKTLTNKDCVWPFFERVRGRVPLYRFVIANFLKILSALKRKDRNYLKALLVEECFKSVEVSSVESTGAQFADLVVRNWMREDTAKAMRWHQVQGHLVVVVSASMDVYMRPIAQYLEIDGLICTKLAQDGGSYSGQLDGPNCRDEEKVRRLENWLHSNANVSTDANTQLITYAYGDSRGDEALLSVAENPIWVRRKDIVIPLSNAISR